MVVSRPIYGEVSEEGPFSDWKEALNTLKLYEKVEAQRLIPLYDHKVVSIKVFGLPFEFWIRGNRLFWRINWSPFKVFLERLSKRIEIYKGFTVWTKEREGIFITSLGSVEDFLVRLIW